MAYPILIGNKKIIEEEIERLDFDKNEFSIVDPERSDKRIEYAMLSSVSGREKVQL